MKQKLLLTGSSGFLGSSLLRVLKQTGKYNLIAPKKFFLDLTRLDQAIKACRKVKVVVHAAGLVLSRVEQNKRPGEVLFQNLASTLNISEAARLARVKKLLFISSVTAYGKNIPAPLKEQDLWLGKPSEANLPYGVSKRVMDTVAQSYKQQYGMETVCLVFPNLYGPGDKFNFNPPPLVPNAISQIYRAKLKKQNFFPGGNNGNQYIELLYVDDAAKAVKLILNKPKAPGLMNIGSGQSVRIDKVFSLISRALGFKGKVLWKKPSLKGSPRHLDVSLMKKELKWMPETSIEKGIQASVEGYIKSLRK